MKKNIMNFEEWLEANLTVTDSILKTATPHSLDFINAMEARRIFTTAIELYRKEKNEQ